MSGFRLLAPECGVRKVSGAFENLSSTAPGSWSPASAISGSVFPLCGSTILCRLIYSSKIICDAFCLSIDSVSEISWTRKSSSWFVFVVSVCPFTNNALNVIICFSGGLAFYELVFLAFFTASFGSPSMPWLSVFVCFFYPFVSPLNFMWHRIPGDSDFFSPSSVGSKVFSVFCDCVNDSSVPFVRVSPMVFETWFLKLGNGDRNFLKATLLFDWFSFWNA